MRSRSLIALSRLRASPPNRPRVVRVRHFLGLLIVGGALALAPTAGTTSAPRVVASFRFATSTRAIVAGDGAVWVTAFRSAVRIDPRTNAMSRPVRLKPILGAVAVAGAQLWIARNPIDTGAIPVRSQLFSVDHVTGKVSGKPISFPLIANLAADRGAVWVTNGDHAQFGRLFRVDPGRRRIVATLKIPGAPSGLVVEQGLLWVVCVDTGYLYRVDPRTTKLVGTPVRAGRALLSVAAGGGRVWVGDGYAGAVNSVDATTGAVVTRTKLRYVSDVAVGQGSVWATVEKPSELVRIEPTTGRIVGRPLPMPETAAGLAIGFGSIWVLTGRRVVRVQA